MASVAVSPGHGRSNRSDSKVPELYYAREEADERSCSCLFCVSMTLETNNALPT